MALYLAVAPVQAEGEKVELPPDDADPVVPAGRRMIAVVSNGEWQAALDVSDPEAYRRLRRRVTDGTWQGMQLYSLDQDRALGLADGRRATMQGRPVPEPGRAARR
jgi:hypothetical protein